MIYQYISITLPDYVVRLKDEIISFHKGNYNTNLLVFTDYFEFLH